MILMGTEIDSNQAWDRPVDRDRLVGHPWARSVFLNVGHMAPLGAMRFFQGPQDQT